MMRKRRKYIISLIIVVMLLSSIGAYLYAPPIMIHSSGVIIGKQLSDDIISDISETKAYSKNKWKYLIFFNWFRTENCEIFVESAEGLNKSSFSEKYKWLLLNSKDKDSMITVFIAKTKSKEYVFTYKTP